MILRMDNLGVPTYNELILVARRESLNEAGASRLRRFITRPRPGTGSCATSRRRASTRC